MTRYIANTNESLPYVQRTTSNPSSASRSPRATGSGSLATSPLVVLLVLLHYFSSTPSTTLVLVLLTMRSPPRAEELVNSTVSLMSTGRLLLLMVLRVSTVDLSPLLSVSSFTVVFTSVFTIHSVSISTLLHSFYLLSSQNPLSLSVLSRALSWRRSSSAGVLPLVLVLLPTLWTQSGKCHYHWWRGTC